MVMWHALPAADAIVADGSGGLYLVNEAFVEKHQ